MRLCEPLKGWHSRGYHPHLDAAPVVQSVTFRLHDSVPAELLERWRTELSILTSAPGEGRHVRRSASSRSAELQKRIETYEDAGHGACWLRDARIARIVEAVLLHHHGKHYRLLEWCIMPNHVHALIEVAPGYSLSDVVRVWKTFSSRQANMLLGRKGRFWMADYFDRYVRDEHHLEAVRRYIRRNPVKAGLCESEEQWRWSSAWAPVEGSG